MLLVLRFVLGEAMRNGRPGIKYARVFLIHPACYGRSSGLPEMYRFGHVAHGARILPKNDVDFGIVK